MEDLITFFFRIWRMHKNANKIIIDSFPFSVSNFFLPMTRYGDVIIFISYLYLLSTTRGDDFAQAATIYLDDH